VVNALIGVIGPLDGSHAVTNPQITVDGAAHAERRNRRLG